MRLLVPLLALLLLCACGPGARRAAVVTRDSAGVRIVENRRQAWPAEHGWRLTREPTVRIGVAQGDPHYEFALVTGAVCLLNGTIVVADQEAQDLGFYDPRGRVVRAARRAGKGPGEFASLRWLGLVGDTLLTFDFDLERLSLFDSAGAFVRDISLAGTPVDRPVRRLGDGSILLVRYDMDAGHMNSGLHTWMAAIDRYSPRGERLDSLGVVPDSQDDMTLRSGGGYTSPTYLFGRFSAFATAGERLYFGDGAEPEFRVYSEDGRLMRLVRWPGRPVRSTSADFDSVLSILQELVTDSAQARRVFASYRKMPRAPTLPTLSGFRLDVAGDLWVGHYRWLRQPPVAWRVFDPKDRLLGDVAVPARFAIGPIGADYVLGVRTDSLGVQHVEEFGLEK